MSDTAPPPPPPPPGQEPPALSREERHRLEKLCEAKCKKYACAIQYCLERHDHQEKRCWKEVGYWNACCDRIKEREAQLRAAQEGKMDGGGPPPPPAVGGGDGSGS